MYFSDYHIHSTCSSDGHNTMLEMALASYEKGVRRLCFTDHCDLDKFMSGEPDPECFCHREKSIEMYAQALNGVPKDMEIFLGMELGEGNHDIERAKEIISAPELDFVLGSIHNLKGKPDFYGTEYKGDDYSQMLVDTYMEELLELSKIDCFDVMAHIGYPSRYIRKGKGKDRERVEISTRTYGEMLEQIFKNLIESGKGIEINCSGFRTPPGGGSLPSVDVLKLYKEMGGEIITVGSDAHKTANAGVGIPEGFDILHDLGYKYVTAYKKRKPEFIKI